MSDANRAVSIKDIENTLLQAQLHKDRAALEQVISEDFVGVNPDGSRVSKAEEIDNLTSTDYLSGMINDLDVKIHGDTAVATGQVVFQSENESYRFSFTDVYVDQKLVSSQAALVG